MPLILQRQKGSRQNNQRPIIAKVNILNKEHQLPYIARDSKVMLTKSPGKP